MARNQPDGFRDPMCGGGIGQWPLGGHFNQDRTGEFERRHEHGGGAGTVTRFLHHMRRAHDLILVASVALLEASRKDLLCGEISDRDARPAYVLAQDHRTMGHDAHQDDRRLRIVQMRVGRRLTFRRDRKTRKRGEKQGSQNETKRNPPIHLTLVPGSTASRIVTSPFTSLSPAARTIPWDSTPISFAGLRFATITIVFPTSASGSYFLPMPATIWRCSLPRLTCNLMSFSDFGTRSAVSTFAVLN